ncbi:uncharacterized protein N7473_000971 [Penicillium subrubescens]|uniref:uncharacterized protein n=1 Tax=Penicillium subrubescens TaxID=1316194 RepID=UPI00254556B1|nr:uncharacterized protein N7473_000971 [Penicillium subrubescens]KAJ5911668.1 hypothetical protein N7473_000971 [Penicillium subrubescens]
MVTGAGTGIGADTAFLLAERGAKVVIVGRREAPLHEVEQRIVAASGEVLVAVADVSDIAQVEKVVENTLEVSGENFDLPDLPKGVWDETIAINLSSIFYCMKAQIRAIDQVGGVEIMNVSSVLADRGLVWRAPYTATNTPFEVLPEQLPPTGLHETSGSMNSNLES